MAYSKVIKSFSFLFVCFFQQNLFLDPGHIIHGFIAQVTRDVPQPSQSPDHPEKLVSHEAVPFDLPWSASSAKLVTSRKFFIVYKMDTKAVFLEPDEISTFFKPLRVTNVFKLKFVLIVTLLNETLKLWEKGRRRGELNGRPAHLPFFLPSPPPPPFPTMPPPFPLNCVCITVPLLFVVFFYSLLKQHSEVVIRLSLISMKILHRLGYSIGHDSEVPLVDCHFSLLSQVLFLFGDHKSKQTSLQNVL